MIRDHFLAISFLVGLLIVPGDLVLASSTVEEQHHLVAMRMIGHKVLIMANRPDATVLPIGKEGDSYKILFSTDFSFDPGALVQVVDSVIFQADLSNGYIVEMKDCDSNRVVYSYEMGSSDKTDLVPCLGRVMPSACYQMLVTLLPNLYVKDASEIALADRSSHPAFRSRYATILIAFFFLGLVAFSYHRWKMTLAKKNADLISLGDYTFNRRMMTLSHKNGEVALTSKEAELLTLLHRSKNKTLEREDILNIVWGDDGDYTGRTLDVFISKLRKKLDSDQQLKIINIRGVGYKFVVNQ